MINYEISMNAHIITASISGTAYSVGEWLRVLLSAKGFVARHDSVEDYLVSEAKTELYILGSDITGHKVLPKLNRFIQERSDLFVDTPVALFGATFRHVSCGRKCGNWGRTQCMQEVTRQLNNPPLHSDLLLSQKDAKAFIKALNKLSAAPA